MTLVEGCGSKQVAVWDRVGVGHKLGASRSISLGLMSVGIVQCVAVRVARGHQRQRRSRRVVAHEQGQSQEYFLG